MGATDFAHRTLFCRYEFLTPGERWTRLDGSFSGQTQLSHAKASQNDGDLVTWNHPIDGHFATTAVEGWPRLNLEVWHEDRFGRHELCAWLLHSLLYFCV